MAANETELERLIVRIVSESQQYRDDTNGVVNHTKNITNQVEQHYSHMGVGSHRALHFVGMEIERGGALLGRFNEGLGKTVVGFGETASAVGMATHSIHAFHSVASTLGPILATITSPIGWVGLAVAVGAAVWAVTSFSEANKEAKEEAKKAAEEIKHQHQVEAKEVADLLKEYHKLNAERTGLKEGKTFTLPAPNAEIGGKELAKAQQELTVIREEYDKEAKKLFAEQEKIQEKIKKGEEKTSRVHKPISKEEIEAKQRELAGGLPPTATEKSLSEIMERLTSKAKLVTMLQKGRADTQSREAFEELLIKPTREASEEARKAMDSLRGMDTHLKEQAETFGMSSTEAFIYIHQLETLNDAELQGIANSMRASETTIALRTEKARLAEETRSLIQHLEQEAIAIGKTREEMQLYKMAMAGVKGADMEHVEQTMQFVKLQTEVDAAFSKGKSMAEQSLTPLQKHYKTQQDLGALLKMHAIDQNTYNRELAKANAELTKTSGIVGTITAGSVEEMAAIRKQVEGMRAPTLVGKQTLPEQLGRQLTDTLGNLQPALLEQAKKRLAEGEEEYRLAEERLKKAWNEPEVKEPGGEWPLDRAERERGEANKKVRAAQKDIDQLKMITPVAGLPEIGHEAYAKPMFDALNTAANATKQNTQSLDKMSQNLIWVVDRAKMAEPSGSALNTANFK